MFPSQIISNLQTFNKQSGHPIDQNIFHILKTLEGTIKYKIIAANFL